MSALFTANLQLTPKTLSSGGSNGFMEEDNVQHVHSSGQQKGVLTDRDCDRTQSDFTSMSPEDAIPMQLSLSRQIQHLRHEMDALRGNSSLFREKMEFILTALENLNEASLRARPSQASFTEEIQEFEEPIKTPISFGNSARKNLVTGIASRISREDVDVTVVKHPYTPNDESIQTKISRDDGLMFPVHRVAPDTYSERNITNGTDIQLRNQVNEQSPIHKKIQLKTSEPRPNSDSFVPTSVASRSKDTIEREITISQQNGNVGKEENFSNPSPKSASGEEQVRMIPVLDRTSKSLLTSEDSIDSGYHGGMLNHHAEQNEDTETRLSSVCETCSREDVNISESKENNHKVELALSFEPRTSEKAKEECQSLNQDKNVVDIQPTAPTRSTKKIKMGVSAVVGPKPKARTVFKPSSENVITKCSTKEIKSSRSLGAAAHIAEAGINRSKEGKRNEETRRVKVTKENIMRNKLSRHEAKDKMSDSEAEMSSALRRRSMRMMTEFKLVDFPDAPKCEASMKNSPTKSSPGKSKSVVRKPAANISEKISLESVMKVVTSHSSISSKVENDVGKVPRRTSSVKIKKRLDDNKYQREALPPPPLPPPPSPPKELLPISKEPPAFTGFTSLATHEERSLVCNAGNETPVSSPRCVRRPVHGSNRSIQSTGTTNDGGLPAKNVRQVANITPSVGSAFTPVGFTNRNFLESTPVCHHQPRQQSCERINEPTNPSPFKRRSSLPPSAISNRNKLKNNRTKEKPVCGDDKKLELRSSETRNHVNSHSKVATEGNFKRSESMRLTKSKLPYAERSDLENNPISFNRDDNIKSVVGKLKQAGYLANANRSSGENHSWVNTGEGQHKYTSQDSIKHKYHTPQDVRVDSKNSRVGRTPKSETSHGSAKQSPSETARKETIYADNNTKSQQPSKSISMGIIRASFRSKRGKSAPSAPSATNEFSIQHTRPLAVTEMVQAHSQNPPTELNSRQNTRNKVKQRVDLKPATPTPAVAKARRKKLAGEKSSKSSVVGMLMDKLQLSKSDSTTSSSDFASKDDAFLKGRQRKSIDNCGPTAQAVPVSVPTTRRIFRFPSKEDNLRCGSLTSTSSKSSVASHVPSSPMKGLSTYV